MTVIKHTYKIIFFCLLTHLCIATTTGEYNRPHAANTLSYPMNKTPEALRVLSYNIRVDSKVDREKGHSWDKRKYMIKRIIDYYNPDIIGLQEVSNSYLPDIKRLFPNYHLIAHGINKTEQDAILLVNTRRCIIKQSSYFWLAEDPYDADSSTWDARVRRIVVYADIIDRKTQKQCFVFCTHFDSKGTQAKLKSARLLAHEQKLIAKNNPVILLGDFNLFPKAQAQTIYKRLMNNGLQDVRDLSDHHYGPDGSWIGWSYDPQAVLPGAVGTRIDQIFVRSAQVLKEGTLNIKVNARKTIIPLSHKAFLKLPYPSDHLPVIADVVLS